MPNRPDPGAISRRELIRALREADAPEDAMATEDEKGTDVSVGREQETTTPTAQEARMFQYHTTRELLAVNAQYLREYRADPTPGNLAAVNASSIELSRRGA